MGEEGLERHRTARHLDDPTPILLGLGLAQLLGICAGALLPFLVWARTGFLAGGEVAFYSRVTIALVAGALPAGGAYLQFRGKTEPFLLQVLAFLGRPRRYGVGPLERPRYDG